MNKLGDCKELKGEQLQSHSFALVTALNDIWVLELVVLLDNDLNRVCAVDQLAQQTIVYVCILSPEYIKLSLISTRIRPQVKKLVTLNLIEEKIDCLHFQTTENRRNLYAFFK